jgi:hypothetical protein
VRPQTLVGTMLCTLYGKSKGSFQTHESSVHVACAIIYNLCNPLHVVAYGCDQKLCPLLLLFLLSTAWINQPDTDFDYCNLRIIILLNSLYISFQKSVIKNILLKSEGMIMHFPFVKTQRTMSPYFKLQYYTQIADNTDWKIRLHLVNGTA